jgi:hypothetical protein
MTSVRLFLLVVLALLAGTGARAAEVGVATIVDGSTRLLRAATWYRLVPGARLEHADIVDAGERGQVQVELFGGSIVNLVGATAYFVPPPAKQHPTAAGTTLAIPRGWAKVAAKAPGVRLRPASAELAITAGTVVLYTDGMRLEAFVESGGARLAALTPSGGEESVREAKQDEFWSRSASGALVASARPPKAFIDTMPRHYLDALPSFAAKFKTRPQLSSEREISYAEAQPWLAGRDRAVFERRFASRLSDPVFRKAVEPDVARYPTWDRRLHPEKYAPPAPKPLTQQ